MYWDVFISHSDKDEKIANEIVKAINSEFYVWYDENNLILGDDINKAIEKGLKLSAFGLVILSKNFFKNYDLSLKKSELDHFIKNLAEKKKVLLPIWYKLDKAYLDKQIKKYKLDQQLSKIKAIKIKTKSQLPTQILKIISQIKKRPKQKFSTRMMIKPNEVESIVLNQNDLLSGWELENDDFSGQDEVANIVFTDPEHRITLTNAIYYRNTISEMKEVFTTQKNNTASLMHDRRLANPKLGQESYGRRYPGGSFVVFRVSNILIRLQYDLPNARPRISEPKQYARIVDRNIRIFLTMKSLT